MLSSPFSCPRSGSGFRALRNLRPCRYRSHRTDVGLRDDVRSCGAAFRSQAENNRQDRPLSTKVLFAVKLSERPIASQAQSGRLLAFPFFGAKCDLDSGNGRAPVGPTSANRRVTPSAVPAKPARATGRRSRRRSGLPPRDPCAMPAARGCRFGRSQSWSSRPRSRTANAISGRTIAHWSLPGKRYSSSLTRSDSRTRWNPGGGVSPTASSTTASVFTNFFGRTRFARAQSISNASV
jgi:hypothetical protein